MTHPSLRTDSAGRTDPSAGSDSSAVAESPALAGPATAAVPESSARAGLPTAADSSAVTGPAAELIATVGQLLLDATVASVLAYERDVRTGGARPVRIRDVDEARRLVWDPTCVHNLARFFLAERKRQATGGVAEGRPTGIVVKGCDSRAIAVLLQERLIRREEVYLIGVSCGRGGVVDERRLHALVAGQSPTRVAYEEGDAFLVHTPGGALRVPFSELMADRCLDCRMPSPRLYDVLIGEPASRAVQNPYRSLEAIESLSPSERWAFWQREFDRCLRCYACRSVCPMCYCEECVADPTQYAVTAQTTAEEKAQRVRWVEKSTVTAENAFYHLVRAIHMAGRCIDCQECERVCPVNIPLRLLYKAMEKEAEALFGYTAGADPDAPALVASFRMEDPSDFIR